jgi:hypothetical protein
MPNTLTGSQRCGIRGAQIMHLMHAHLDKTQVARGGPEIGPNGVYPLVDAITPPHRFYSIWERSISNGVSSRDAARVRFSPYASIPDRPRRRETAPQRRLRYVLFIVFWIGWEFSAPFTGFALFG